MRAKNDANARRGPALLYLIKRCYAAAKTRLVDMAGAHGLSVSDYTTLSVLIRMEPCSAADLARRRNITPQAATQQVAQLKAKGMLVSRESDANRRIALLSLTKIGRDRFTAVEVEARAYEEEMLAGFDAAQREAVTTFLARAGGLAAEDDQKRRRAGDER